MSKEWLARSIVIVLAVGAIAIPAVASWGRRHGIEIHARMAETGGWTPESLTAVVGVPLRLRLTSDDVIHGFAIGQTDLPVVDVIPGEFSEVTYTFDRPGKYTFYCTRWCGINHWRMRGAIVVSGPGTKPDIARPPLYVSLGLEIDARNPADVVPVQKPSSARGAWLGATIPAAYLSRDYYLAHSPLELWKALRDEPNLRNFSDQDIWDLAALVWKSNATPQELKTGQQLYATNCAACHGESGAGDGVFADQLDRPKSGEHAEMRAGEMTTRPAGFTAPQSMLSASPAQLQGKIIRGGMGTGMPYWGPIFTEEQTWALVAHLWTFQFDLEDRP